MAKFEIYERCQVNNIATAEAIAQLIKVSLAKHYSSYNITVTPTGVTVKGNLDSMFERAMTKADATIRIDGNQLSYCVNGNSSLGGWPWVWFVLGLFTGIFFGLFILDLIEYIVCRDRPKRYFEEAFKAVQFEFGSLHPNTTAGASNAPHRQEPQTMFPSVAFQPQPPLLSNTFPPHSQLPTTENTAGGFHWMPMTSFLSGLFMFIAACCGPDGKWESGEVTRVILLAFVPIVFGIIALVSGRKKRWMAITGLSLGSLAALIAIGNS